MDTAFVDPAGLEFIRSGPSGAGGASKAIYQFLGVCDSFPDPVKSAIHKDLDAKLHTYSRGACGIWSEGRCQGADKPSKDITVVVTVRNGWGKGGPKFVPKSPQSLFTVKPKLIQSLSKVD